VERPIGGGGGGGGGGGWAGYNTVATPGQRARRHRLDSWSVTRGVQQEQDKSQHPALVIEHDLIEG